MKKLFIIAIFSLLPSVTLAYSLVVSPTQGVAIIDQGEVTCGMKRSNANQGKETFNCKNSFSHTEVRVSGVEVTNYSGSVNTTNIIVQVNGSIPLPAEYVNKGQTKILNVGATIPAGTDVIAFTLSCIEGCVTDIRPSKIYFNIYGEERITTLTPDVNAAVFSQNEDLYLYIMDTPLGSSTASIGDYYCKKTHGENSVFTESECSCKGNNVFNLQNQCVPAQKECLRYGPKGIPIGSTCGCSYGTYLEQSKQQCVLPVKNISANVKNWVDDNFAHANLPCSSNVSFSKDELAICDQYNNSFIRQKYEWQVEKPAPVSIPVAAPLPTLASALPLPKPTPTNTLVAPTTPVSTLPKPKITSEKPKSVETEKATTTTKIIFAATTTEHLAPAPIEQVVVAEEVKTLPQPKPKPFWSRIVSWFKFW